MSDNLAGVGNALDVSLPSILGDFRLLHEQAQTMRPLATEMPLRPHTGTTVNVINYNRGSAIQLTDGVDLVQGHQLADTLTQYTPSEYGIKVILPWTTLRRIADPDLEGKVAKIMADAYAFREDAALADELINFTTALAAAGTVISPGHVAAAVARVKLGNTRRVDSSSTRPEPPGSRVIGVLHPLHTMVVAGRLVPFTDVPVGTNAYGVNTGAHVGTTVGPGRADGLSNDIITQGPSALGMISGAPLYECPNINVDSSDDASSAVFAQEGLIFVPEVEPDGWKEDDPSNRHTEIGIVGAFGTGTWRPDINGVEIRADASMPTS
jgi:hypothetical protein